MKDGTPITKENIIEFFESKPTDAFCGLCVMWIKNPQSHSCFSDVYLQAVQDKD